MVWYGHCFENKKEVRMNCSYISTLLKILEENWLTPLVIITRACKRAGLSDQCWCPYIYIL